MTKAEYRKLASIIRHQRNIWKGYSEAQTAIDGLIVELAKHYASTRDGFRVAQWVEWCGTNLIMGWLPASIERDKAAEKARRKT